jgi:predicted Rossmann fold flavoprotein
MRTQRDVIIIGAGAAGLFCAIQAGRRGRSVLVLERAATGAKKVSISGGGRCNFTNLHTRPDHFICRNPHFVKAALARFTPRDFIDLVKKHGIGYHEKTAGQIFCDDSASAIIQMLLKECAAANVEILLNCEPDTIRKDGRFLVDTNRGCFEGHSLVIATGGLSYPQIGATDLGYRIAKQFGLRIEPTRPALVPLILSKEDQAFFSPLSGIALEAAVQLGKRKFKDSLLFTHRGFSGPVILQISSYWNPGETIVVDLAPGQDVAELFLQQRNSARELKTLLSHYWPERFAKLWTERYAVSKPMRHYSNKELRAIEAHLHGWQITPAGTEGYRKAEVTAGGVDTAELSSQTMETRRVPGLYFVGEVMDVTGQLGGFNFQWAWASAFAAGQAV